jgi:hypothetical protein
MRYFVRFLFLFIGIGLMFLFSACNGCSSNKNDSGKQEPEVSLEELVTIWNNANNNKDINVLRSLYDSIVHFYQYKYTIDECLKSKTGYFAEYPDFKQNIEGKIFIDTLKNNFVRINFTKKVFQNNEEKQIPAYLVFIKHNNVWKIYAESDLYTDRLLSTGGQIPSNAVAGDFDGDGVTNYMWLEVMDETEECKIRFSGPIPPVIISTCLGGIPVNEGDLDGDGADEVGILPVWESSCWKGYFVYTFKDNQWIEALDPISIHCIQWEKNILPVVKDSTKKGYVFVNYSELTDDGIEVKTKSVNLNKR